MILWNNSLGQRRQVIDEFRGTHEFGRTHDNLSSLLFHNVPSHLEFREGETTNHKDQIASTSECSGNASGRLSVTSSAPFVSGTLFLSSTSFETITTTSAAGTTGCTGHGCRHGNNTRILLGTQCIADKISENGSERRNVPTGGVFTFIIERCLRLNFIFVAAKRTFMVSIDGVFRVAKSRLVEDLPKETHGSSWATCHVVQDLDSKLGKTVKDKQLVAAKLRGTK